MSVPTTGAAPAIAAPQEPVSPLEYRPLAPLVGALDQASNRINGSLAMAYEIWQSHTAAQAAAEDQDTIAQGELLDRMAESLTEQCDVAFDGAQPGVTVLIKTTDQGAELVAAGIATGARIGDIVTAFIPFDRLAEIALLPSVLRMEAAARYDMNNDAGTADARAPAVWSNYADTGSNVIVGIIDSGVDPFHPDFIKPDGQTRFKYLLDFSDPGDPDSDGQLNGAVYGGTQYTEAQINAALASPGWFYHYPGSSVAIPNNSAAGVNSTINVSQGAEVTSAAVDLYISHPNVGDLKVTLTCPNGAQAVLFNRTGGDRDDVIGTFPVSACNGQGAAGAWRLNVADLVSNNYSGGLVLWNLHVNRPVRITDQVGHGTHVLGSAGGDGSATGAGLPAGTFKGMAPTADLIAVRGVRDFIGGISDAEIINGLSFIDQKAAELGRPYVVNLSLGGHYGAHDGTSLVEQAIDILVGPGKPGKAIVISAGNEGDETIHAAGQAPQGGTKEVSFFIPTPPAGYYSVALIDVWYDGSDSFGVGFRDPSGNGLDRTINPGQTGGCVTYNDYSAQFCIASMSNSSANGDKEILIQVQAANSRAGTWKILLQGDQVTSGRFDGWILGGSEWRTDVSNNMRVGMPGTARNAITVGAHVTKNQWTDVAGVSRSIPATLGSLAAFSSDGPTRDGRQKPDITAPGQEICSTLSGQSPVAGVGSMYSTTSDICQDGVHGVSQGTSMSAPHVTGAVALLLGLNPDLDAAQIKNALTGHAGSDAATGSVPNSKWGYGKLDVFEAIPTPTHTPTPTASPTATHTPSPTASPTATRTPTPTGSPTVTPAPTTSPTHTSTPTSTARPGQVRRTYLPLLLKPSGGTSANLPDLAFQSAHISMQLGGGCVLRFTPLMLYVCLANQGNTAAGPFTIGVNGEDRARVAGIAAGAQSCVEAGEATYAMAFNSVIVLDRYNEVVESSKANNTWAGSIPYPTPPATCTATSSPTTTSTLSATPSVTPTATATPSPTSTATPTPSATPSPTPSPTPTATSTPSATPTPTYTPTNTPTGAPQDGNWTGMTDQGRAFSFPVSGGGTWISQLVLHVNAGGACGISSVDHYFYSIAITGGGFHATSMESEIAGSFADATTVVGVYKSVISNSLTGCRATRTGTWTATWDGPASQGIYGRVTYLGSAAAGIPLQLRYFSGSSWSTQATTTTDSDGRYSFQGVPSLAPGASYYVLFGRNTANANWVSFWVNPDITNYAAGSAVLGGNFDLANIVLSSPANGYSSALPVTFQWVKRSIPGDTYRWLMFDPDTGDGWITNDLGSASSFTLTALPSGATYGKQYGWWVRAYQGPYSYGYSFEARGFTAQSAASSADDPAAPAQQEMGLSRMPSLLRDPQIGWK
ncbi:MAG: S8 family serine peptidase [Chloroflexi bacterium]|nr:S8 family serine peptidase [Chloroflexota bacterium]